MAKETIYLCNFRVSVNGDWLCLEELNDIELDVEKEMADHNRVIINDPVLLERTNLLNVLKLIIKEILDTSLSYGRMLDDDNTALQQFFLVLEHILRHGLKYKKGIMRDRKECWGVLESLEMFSAEAKDITLSVRELPNVKTDLGRARAWLRLALMQKKLPDYFKQLIDMKEQVLNDMYEEGSFMSEEEAGIMCGLLVGLNVIDCSISVKDEDLDRPIGVIDFGLYLKENSQTLGVNTPMELSRGSKQMAAILDQKNYLEELNRHLSATVTSLQQKLEGLQTATILIKEDLLIAQDNILQLQHENSRLKSDKHDEVASEESKSNSYQDESSEENEKLLTKLQEEVVKRQALEKELEGEMISKTEMEVMMKIMEKDLKIRQNSLVSMKKENEALKSANSQLKQQLCPK